MKTPRAYAVFKQVLLAGLKAFVFLACFLFGIAFFVGIFWVLLKYFHVPGIVLWLGVCALFGLSFMTRAFYKSPP